MLVRAEGDFSAHRKKCTPMNLNRKMVLFWCFYFVRFHVSADVSRVHSSALSSADGSAENQMIVESDDFNSPL